MIELVLLLVAGTGLKLIFGDYAGVDLWWLVISLGVVSGSRLLFLPQRKYHSWAYMIENDELHIHYGLWRRHEVIVPLRHVQHIDIRQGLAERVCNVCALVVHTAGLHNAVVELIGLSRPTAEHLRDTIRARFREDIA